MSMSNDHDIDEVTMNSDDEVGMSAADDDGMVDANVEEGDSKIYPVRQGAFALEQHFTYRQYELHDELIDESFAQCQPFSFLFLGDQNAGKSTFLHSFSKYQDKNFTALQSFLPTITSQFSNQCFVPNPSINTCDEPPYLDTDLGRATLVLSTEAFLHFCDDFGFTELPKVEKDFVVIELHEMGGDHLDRIMKYNSKSSGENYENSQQNPADATDQYLLEETVLESTRVLRKVSHLLYFVNAKTATKDKLLKRLQFLNRTCQQAKAVTFYCSRVEEEDSHNIGVETIGASKSSDSFAGIPTLMPFEEVFRSIWHDEQADILKLENSSSFRQIKSMIQAWIIPSLEQSTAANSGSVIKCAGIYATKNLNSDGSIAVCSVVLVLLRLIYAEHARLALNQSASVNHMQGDAAFGEFIALLFLCFAEWRRTEGQTYISVKHWDRFLEDKIVVSPDVNEMFTRGCERIHNSIGVLWMCKTSYISLDEQSWYCIEDGHVEAATENDSAGQSPDSSEYWSLASYEPFFALLVSDVMRRNMENRIVEQQEAEDQTASMANSPAFLRKLQSVRSELWQELRKTNELCLLLDCVSAEWLIHGKNAAANSSPCEKKQRTDGAPSSSTESVDGKAARYFLRDERDFRMMRVRNDTDRNELRSMLGDKMNDRKSSCITEIQEQDVLLISLKVA